MSSRCWRIQRGVQFAQSSLFRVAVLLAPLRFVTFALRLGEFELNLQGHAARPRCRIDQFAFGLRHRTLRMQRLRVLAQRFVGDRGFSVQPHKVVRGGRFGEPALLLGVEVGAADSQCIDVALGVVPKMRLHPGPFGWWCGVGPAQRQAFVEEMLRAVK